jgi:hypothetical protein
MNQNIATCGYRDQQVSFFNPIIVIKSSASIRAWNALIFLPEASQTKYGNRSGS